MLKIKDRMEQDPYQVAEVAEERNIAEDSALNEAMLMACQDFEKNSLLLQRPTTRVQRQRCTSRSRSINVSD